MAHSNDIIINKHRLCLLLHFSPCNMILSLCLSVLTLVAMIVCVLRTCTVDPLNLNQF